MTVRDHLDAAAECTEEWIQSTIELTGNAEHALFLRLSRQVPRIIQGI